MKIIAIVGAARSGKSTAAELLQSKVATRVRFAQTLKDMLMTMGLTKEQVDGSEKEVPLDLLGGKTPRWAMQTLGTEWCNLITKNLWSNILERKLQEKAMLDTPTREQVVLVDDCRFPHEVEMVKRLGGQIWMIRRPEVEPQKWYRFASEHAIGRLVLKLIGKKPIHESELHWWHFDVDEIFWNEGSLEDFLSDMKAAINKIRK